MRRRWGERSVQREAASSSACQHTDPPKKRCSSVVAGYCTGQQQGETERHPLRPGFRVFDENTKREGEIEFIPGGRPGDGDVLVQFGSNLEDYSTLRWVPRKQLRLLDGTCGRLKERADVKAYRDAVKAIELSERGTKTMDIARQFDRSESWVQRNLAYGSIEDIPKPKGMEWWDPKGFCDVTYIRGYAHEEGLYNEIVQSVEWDQDKVWRVRKQQDEDSWHLRTVKECPGKKGRGFCGRSLQKVPDNTHQIGPHDRREAATTRVHSQWVCEKAAQFMGCCKKPRFEDPAIEPYWWCPSCKWYACDACVRQMPDKATSKQLWHWRPGLCPRFDQLVQDIVEDFCLPDPLTERYTVKMNWYPDGLARVSPHRHDNWTVLLSLGSPRVLTVDRASVLMEDGDIILFGTQSHGVPEMPSCKGGRLSVVLMFAPDPLVGAAASTRLSAGAAYARRGTKPPSMPLRPAKLIGNSYQGIPDEVQSSSCPNGHSLEDARVPAGAKGVCNACARHIRVGEVVLMCRPCNFGLCGACHSGFEDRPLDVVSDTALTGLCGLGFAYHDAKAALTSAFGNVELAASLLLAAKDMETHTQSPLIDIDEQTEPIVID